MKTDIDRAVCRGLSLKLAILALAIISSQAQTNFTDANWVNTFGLPGASGAIYTMAKDSNGNIYVGGKFTGISTILATNIAKWNGRNWSALPSGMSTASIVYSLACDNSGNVYAGGNFSFLDASGSNAVRVAKWNGNAWSALDTGINNTVLALACDNAGNVYAGGSFSQAGEATVANVAQWNGSAWSALGLGTSSTVNCLICDNSGNLYVGGAFGMAGGLTASGVAKWDGANWSPLSSGINNPVYALTFDTSGNLYAGGQFTMAGSSPAANVAVWNGAVWSPVGSGVGINHGPVSSLAFDKTGNLYAGGSFGGLLTPFGVQTTNIAEWNGSAWSTIGVGLTPNGSGAPPVSSIVLDKSGNLFVGGAFTTENNINASYIATYNTGVWSPISAGIPNSTLASVYSFAFDGSGNYYVGGQFGTAGGATVTNIAKWNGNAWVSIGSVPQETTGSPGAIFAVVLDHSGNLYAGGSYGLGQWNGTNWSVLGTGLYGTVSSLAIAPSGNLYAGGTFTANGGVTAMNIAEWDGTNWSPLVGLGINGAVSALVFDKSGNLYAGGNFTFAGGITASNVAEWNGTNWLPLGAGLTNSVRALAFDPAGNLYAGSGSNAVKWDGTNWSNLGTGMYRAVAGAVVNAVAVDCDGNVFAGGSFTNASGVSANYVAKWNGTNWSGLGSGMGGNAAGSYVLSLAFDPVGNLYVGGYFTSAGTNLSYHIAEALLSKSSYNLALANLGAGSNVITGLGTPGYSYALDFTTSLTPPITWLPLVTNTSSTQSFVFTNETISPRGFYRTRYVPQ